MVETFSYVDSMATSPGTAISFVTATPAIGFLPQVHGDRRSDGSWLFSINPIDPHVTYTFVAYTDLSFPNSAGNFVVPSDVSFAGTCIPCPPSGPERATVSITISEVPEAGNLLLLGIGLMVLTIHAYRLTLTFPPCEEDSFTETTGFRGQPKLGSSKPPPWMNACWRC
jgi:hypothetical protein